MDKAAEEPAATGENQEIWEFSESEEKGVAGTLVAKEKAVGRAVASGSSENSVNLKLKRRNGHIISVRLQQWYHTLKKQIQS